MNGASGLCAVCACPATITDWRPLEDWLAVDGCSCNGFFMSKWLWAGPLRTMRTAKRRELGARIRFWRANGREAWVPSRTVPTGVLSFPESGARSRLAPKPP